MAVDCQRRSLAFSCGSHEPAGMPAGRGVSRRVNESLKHLASVRETGMQFWEHKGPRLGAALAFYTALSLSPLFLVVIALAGFVYGEAAARGEIAHQIRDTVGDDGAKAIQSLLAEQQSTQKGILMTIVGVATLLIGASGVFAELQDAIDTIWDVKRDSKSGLWGTIRDRLVSFSVVCGIAFLLLVSLVISAFLSAVNGWMDRHFSIGAPLMQVCNQIVSFGLTTLLFAMIFKVLPQPASLVGRGPGLDHRRPVRHRQVFDRCLPGTSSVYMGAGSFVVLLI